MADAIGSLFIDLSMQTASFDAATKRVESQVKGLTSKIQSSFSALKGGLAATGLLVAAQHANQWARAMAEAADQAEDFAAALGMTLKQTVELTGMFRLAGGSMEEARKAMQRLNGSITDARGGQEAAIANFKAIGISVNELGDDPVANLERMAKAWTDLEDDATKSAIFADILGPGFIKIIDLITKTSGGLAQLKKDFQRLDPDAQAAAESGSKLKDSYSRLDTATAGLSNTFLNVLGPAIKASVDSFTEFVSGIGRALTAIDSFLGPLGGLAGALNAVAAAARSIVAPPQEILNDLEKLVALRERLLRGGVGGGTAQVLADRDAETESLNKGAGPDPAGAKAAADKKAAAEVEARGLAAANASSLWDPVKAPPGPLKKATIPNKGGGGGSRKGGGGGGKEDEVDKEWKDAIATFKELAEEAEDAALAMAEGMKDISDELFDRRIKQIRNQLDLEKISGREAVDAERQVANEKWEAHKEFYRQKREAAEGDKKKLADLDRQEKLEHERHLTELGQLDHDKVKLRFDDFKDAARDLGNVLENAFSNAFDGITEGTFKLRTALGGLLKDLGRMIANKAFQMLLNGGSSSSSSGGGLLGTIFGMFTGGGGKGGVFGDGWSAAELGMPALASGGSFRVGGSGGIDSQLIAARMTPGELVEVTPPGQVGGGMGGPEVIRLEVDNAFIAGIADQQITTRSGTIIQVAEARAVRSVQRNWSGMSSEASQRQL